MRPSAIRFALLLVAGLFPLLLYSPQAAWADTDTFAVVTDTHLLMYPENDDCTKQVMEHAAKIEGLDAFINCGDVSNVGGKDQYEAYRDFYDESGLKATMIQAIGNHDNAAGGYGKWLGYYGYEGYDRNTGIDYFTEVLNGGELNTVHEFDNSVVMTIGRGFKQDGGTFTQEMLEWLDKQLSLAVGKGKVPIVVCHYAPWHSDESSCLRGLKQVFGICQSYPDVVYMCGHEHDYGEFDVPAFQEGYIYDDAQLPEFIVEEREVHPVILLCLDSVSRTKGVFGTEFEPGRDVNFYLLEIGDDGKASFKGEDLTEGKQTCSAGFQVPVRKKDVISEMKEAFHSVIDTIRQG